MIQFRSSWDGEPRIPVGKAGNLVTDLLSLLGTKAKNKSPTNPLQVLTVIYNGSEDQKYGFGQLQVQISTLVPPKHGV